jgi:hypothetical protein
MIKITITKFYSLLPTTTTAASRLVFPAVRSQRRPRVAFPLITKRRRH